MKKDYKYNKGFEAMKNNVYNTSYGLCPAQMNAIITEQILDKYSKKWIKDWNHFENSRH